MATPAAGLAGGQQASLGASVNVTWPTHNTGDLGVLIVETSGNSSSMSAPSGWSEFSGSPVVDVATTSGSKMHVFYRRATSNAEAAVATGALTDHIVAKIVTFTGVIDSGLPYDVITTGTKATASTTSTIPSLTTTMSDTLIVMIAGRSLDSASTTAYGAYSNANLSSIGELTEAGTTNGNGGGFVVAYGTKATAGSTGTSTATVLSTSEVYLTFALHNTPQINKSESVSVKDTNLIDSYPVAFYDSNGVSIGSGSTYTKQGQSFIGDGRVISKASFYIQKSGSPTGNAVVCIYNTTGTHGFNAVPSGAALATSDNVDVSALSTSMTVVDFTFSGVNQITLTAGTVYVVALEFSGGSSGNSVVMGVDGGTTLGHGGNVARYTGGAWGNATLLECIFYLYSADGGATVSIQSSGPATLSVNKSESVTVSESVGRMAENFINKSDSTTVSESRQQEVESFIRLTPLVYEQIVSDPATGTKKGDTTYVATGGGYLRFQTATNFSAGQFEYTGDLGANFSMSCDFWAGGGSGADSNFFYWGAALTPTQEDSAQNQYGVVLNEFSDQIEVRFNGTSIATQAYSNLDNSTWRKVRADVVGNNIKVYVDGVLQINVTDSTRTLGGTRYGWGGRSGGTNNEHRVRNLVVTNGAELATTSESTSVSVITPPPTLTVSVSDSTTLTENLACLTENFVSKSDSVTVTENLLRLLESNIVKSDSISISESLSVSITPEVTKSESVTITETTTVQIEVSTDLSVNVNDSVAVSESVVVRSENFISKSDTTSLTDTPTLLLESNQSVSDSATVSESIKLELNNFVTKSDSVSVSETIQRLVENRIATSDSTTLTESRQLEITSFINKSESITVSESISISIAAAGDYAITVSDNTALSESLKLEPTSFITKTETTTLSESVTPEVTNFISKSDSTTLSESVTALIEVSVSKSDSVSVSEALQREVISFVSKGESATVTDTPTVLVPELLLSTNESVSLSESVITETIGRIAVSDTATLSESVTTVIPELLVSVSDSTTVTESAAAQVPVTITVTQNVSVLENKLVTIEGTAPPTTAYPKVIYILGEGPAVQLGGTTYLRL